MNWIHELKIKITTLYVLSTENLDRDENEVDNIYRLLQTKLEKLYEDSRIHRLQMRIKAIGNLSILPIGLQEILCKLEKVTVEYKSMFLNIAIAYGGQKEIVEAIKKIALMAKCDKLRYRKNRRETNRIISVHLTLAEPEPDLILRTSGEKRLSAFLIWQSAYSELVFMDVFWPEFRKIDLMRAIRTYQHRIRKYGR